MFAIRIWAIAFLLYVSGLILYSSLFVLSSNQSVFTQYIKICVAATFCLVFLLPAFLAQSSRLVFRCLGYATLIAYFVYAFFLVGYFSYFGFVPEVYAFSTDSAGDLVEVSNHYFAQIFGISEVGLILCALVFFFLLPRYHLPARASVFLLVPVALFATSLAQFGAPSQTASFGNASLIRRFGLPTFLYMSVQERVNLTSEFLAEEVPYPGHMSQMLYPVRSRYVPQELDPFNTVQKVILVQVESFDPEAVDAVLNGEPVMPFVSNIRKTSCRDFTEFHTIKSVGGSSDAEFAVMTGRLPSNRRQSIRHADFSKMETVYDILARDGVSSYFAHNNNIGFYGRNLAYGQLPNVSTTFLKSSDSRSEYAFAQETLAEALTGSDRLFYYFFNFQSHGPFQGYSAQARDRFRLARRNDITSDYMATMFDVDQTIAGMFTQQEKHFEQGESLFIISSDHPSALHVDNTLLAQSRIPLLLCHKSFDGVKIDNVGSTVNLFATVLDALGVPVENEEIAQSLLSNEPRIVLFPTNTLLYREEEGGLSTAPCIGACNDFFTYTDQYIRVSN